MAELNSRQVIAWANKLRLDDLPSTYERNALKNELNDSIWYVENDSDESFYVIQWGNYDIPKKWLTFVKQLLLNYCGGYTDKFQNIINNISSLKTFLGDSKRFFIEFHSQHKNKFLVEISIEELGAVLLSLSLTENNELKSKITAAGFGKIISHIQNNYQNGKLSDGFLFDLPNNFIEYFYKDFVEGVGVDFPVWNKGGSYGGVPVSLAMFILAYALEVLRSDKTKIVLKYYEHLKKGPLTNQVSFRSDIKGPYNSKLVNLAHFKKSKYQPAARQLVNEMNKIVSEEHRNWFFDGGHELNQYVEKVYDLGLIAVAILTGYRISELRFLLPSYLVEDESTGSYSIKTKIIKTNKGIGTIRSFSDEGAEIIELLCNLHLEDKIANDLPVFSRVNRNTTKINKGAVPYNTMLHCFKDGYKHFLSDQGDHFAEVQGTLSPHNFRHTWVDMALRCFLPEKDHSILSEEIRQHLRHKYGSTWTRRYMDGKFTPVHMRELEEGYLKDLINRISGEESDEFVGPTAIRIKNKVRESMKFIGMDEAIDEAIHELSEELLHLEAHPWGLCVLMQDTQTQAKCYDRKSSTPKYEESSGFETCVGCIHRLSHTSMKEDIIKFVLAHEDFISNYPINSSKLRSISEEAVRVGRMVVEEMGS